MKKSAFTKILAAFAALLLGTASLFATADEYPNKTVRIIVPFAPGGGSDFIARFIANKLQTSLKQSFIVENRPGAGGLLGIDAGLKSPADGYTLTMIASSYTVNPALYPLKYDPVTDMEPVIQLSQGPMILVANPKFAAKNVKELIALAKAKPGSINFASAGTGSITQMASEYFALQAGIKMNHIPYKGSGPALTDTIGGQTDIFMSSTASAIPQIKAGKLVALGVTTQKRLAALPDVPTIAEAGVAGYDVPIWHGLIAPKGTPAAVIERINKEVSQILGIKETGEELQKDGVSPAGGTSAQFREVIKREIGVWKKVVADGNIKVE